MWYVLSRYVCQDSFSPDLKQNGAMEGSYHSYHPFAKDPTM